MSADIVLIFVKGLSVIACETAGMTLQRRVYLYECKKKHVRMRLIYFLVLPLRLKFSLPSTVTASYKLFCLVSPYMLHKQNTISLLHD